MNRRPFWVRSISAEDAAAMTPYLPMTADLKLKPLMLKYPGYMGGFSAYYGMLNAGCTARDISAHPEEELFVLLSGDVDVITSEREYRIGPGSFVHFPPDDWHGMRSIGPESGHFLVLKWTWQNPAHTRPAARLLLFDVNTLDPWSADAGIRRQRVCQSQPLANGGRMVVEAVRLAPHTGYPAHSHDHDLMLILLRGQMHGIGHTTDAPAVIYYPAGTVHGLAPLCPDLVDMMAFEFHRPPG